MLKRSPIRKKKKVTKVSWRSGKVRLDAKGMEELRIECYLRSEGQCENTAKDGFRCRNRVTWKTGEMHHVIHRSRSGSDELSNVAMLCRECHTLHHLKNLEIVRHGILS